MTSPRSAEWLARNVAAERDRPASYPRIRPRFFFAPLACRTRAASGSLIRWAARKQRGFSLVHLRLPHRAPRRGAV
jgi:hypothetical protein